MLTTLMYFLLALMLLVIVHEYGHFQVARWCGVRVLRFSFGFGKVLASYRDKKGTEYAFSLLPLGGYIKMLDETEGEVKTEDRPYAFNTQPLLARVAIVLAGPLFNFIFAFLALWLVLVIGVHTLAPMVDSVRPESIAAKAGLIGKTEIVAVNNHPVNSWRDFQYLLMPYIGSKDSIQLTLRSEADGHQSSIQLPLHDWRLDEKKPDLLASLGITPFVPKFTPELTQIAAHSPAEAAGLMLGDTIVQMQNKPLADWQDLVSYVRAHPGGTLELVILRNGQKQRRTLTIGKKRIEGEEVGFIGVTPKPTKWPAHWLRSEREGPLAAIPKAFEQTASLAKTTIILIGRLVTGQLGFKSISGPVGIAEGAGNSGRDGLVSYLFFLALVSVSLGVLNLLPIPLLDGGHLLYYVLEIIKGKPLSELARSIGLYFGLGLLVLLTTVALYNDLSRLTAG